MFLDYLKSKKRLISQALLYKDAYEKLLTVIDVSQNIQELRKYKNNEFAKEDLLILEGSDLGKGEIRFKTWAAKLLARWGIETLNATDAINYFSIIMQDPVTNKEVEILIQRKEENSLTPAAKNCLLEAQIHALKIKLEEATKVKSNE